MLCARTSPPRSALFPSRATHTPHRGMNQRHSLPPTEQALEPRPTRPCPVPPANTSWSREKSRPTVADEVLASALATRAPRHSERTRGALLCPVVAQQETG